MAEFITIARPYAKAAFEYALAHKQIDTWLQFLATAESIIADPAIQKLLNDPMLHPEQWVQLLQDLCGDNLNGDNINESQLNLLKLLANRHRLAIIPALHQHFLQYCREQQKAVTVEIRTAFPLTEMQQEKFARALKIRLQREINLEVNVDESIIGGALIRAGDFVIDGTVRGQLKRLSTALET